jgi:serine/threonine protein kinase
MENNNRLLNDYAIITVIGKGSFAKVMLARHKTSENLYALKSMKKKYI